MHQLQLQLIASVTPFTFGICSIKEVLYIKKRGAVPDVGRSVSAIKLRFGQGRAAFGRESVGGCGVEG